MYLTKKIKCWQGVIHQNPIIIKFSSKLTRGKIERMAKGFGTKQLNQAKQKNKKRTPKPLVSINEIQDSLLGYVDEIEDLRVERSQRHKLTANIAIATKK